MIGWQVTAIAWGTANVGDMQMHKLMIAAGATALLAASSLTSLADEVTGEVQSFDPAARTVTLADGSSYMLPADFDPASLHEGMNVWIEYAPGTDGPLVATALAAQGEIQSIDPAARSITLADGTSFVLPQAVDPASLQVGMNVQIEFTADADGKLMASAIEPAG